MYKSEAEWIFAGIRNGWLPPPPPFLSGLPVIRHIRYLWQSYKVEKWYSTGPGTLGLRTGRDDWMLAGIWGGWA